MALPLGDDEQAREPLHVNDGARSRAARAWREPGAQRDFAAAEVVNSQQAVGMDSREAAGGHDRRRPLGFYAPEDMPRRSVEAERLRGGPDDEAVTAEERGTQVDPRDERAPARGVAQLRSGRHRCFGRARRGAGDREGSVGLGRRVDLGVFLARLAEGVAGLAERAAEGGQTQVTRLGSVAAKDGAHERAPEREL